MSYSRRFAEKQHEAAKTDFWRQIHSDLVVKLKDSSVFSVRQPAPATAGLIDARNSYSFFVYWVEATPSVDAVILIDGATGDEMQLDVSDVYDEENRRETAQGVVCHVAYKWKKSEIPEILSRVDTRVALVVDGTPQHETVAIHSSLEP